jgi:integrase
MSDEELQRFAAAFDDEDGFAGDLAKHQKRSGKVVHSSRFGHTARSFGGGLKPGSDAAKAYFERFQRSRDLFIAGAELGFRPTDLRLLKRPALNFEDGLVSITPRKTRKSSGKTVVLPMSDRCRIALERALSHTVTSSEYVFSDSDGDAFPEVTINRYFRIALRLAGITPQIRLTDAWRHTFASGLASNGANTLTIRDALGHSSTRMAERYARPSAASLEEVRNALNRRSQKPGKGVTHGVTRAANE